MILLTDLRSGQIPTLGRQLGTVLDGAARVDISESEFSATRQELMEALRILVEAP